MEILSEEYYRDDEIDYSKLITMPEYLDYLRKLGYHIYYDNTNESDAFCFSNEARGPHFIKVCMWQDYLEGSIEDEYNNSKKIYIVNDITKEYTDLCYGSRLYETYKIKLVDNNLELYKESHLDGDKLVFILGLVAKYNAKSARML